MLLLLCLIIVAVLAIATVIGGFFILLFGGAGVLVSLLDLLIGGFIIWIPIHCFRKSKHKKGGK